MVRLHALKSVHKEGTALEVDGSLLDRDGTFGGAAGPKGVSHRSPWVLNVGSEQRLARGADMETRCRAGDLEVDNRSLVVQALDSVEGAVLGQLDGTVVSVEARLVFAKVLVVEGGRAPEVRLGLVGVEDLAVELAGRANTTVRAMLVGTMMVLRRMVTIRNVAVDNLGKGYIAIIAKEIEALGFNRCRIHGLPLQVITLELSKGRSDGLMSNRSDGTGAVDGLLSASDICQPGGG